jgi:hypothetical protein
MERQAGMQRIAASIATGNEVNNELVWGGGQNIVSKRF